MQAGAGRFYLPQLDGLRFVAAALVFVAHTEPVQLVGFRHLQDIGWIGVDLFLALSAFLLTRLLVLEFERTGSIDIRNFFVRRLLRIWPLHWAFVTVMLGLHCYLYPKAVTEGFGFWLSHLFFVNNVLLSTLGFESRLAFTSHLWTVSLEEQFYLVIPLVMGLVLRGRVGPRRLAQGMGVTLLVLMGMRAACVLLRVPYPFVMALPLRGDAIVMGVLLGAAFPKIRRAATGGIKWIMAGVLLVAVVAILPSIEMLGWQQIPGYTVVALACSLLLMGVLRDNFVSRVLSVGVLRYLGKISFGIYVYHVFCMAAGKKIADAIAPGSWCVATLASAALTLSVAALSYQFFEKRFLVIKERFAVVKSRPS